MIYYFRVRHLSAMSVHPLAYYNNNNNNNSSPKRNRDESATTTKSHSSLRSRTHAHTRYTHQKINRLLKTKSKKNSAKMASTMPQCVEIHYMFLFIFFIAKSKNQNEMDNKHKNRFTFHFSCEYFSFRFLSAERVSNYLSLAPFASSSALHIHIACV